ncbi:ABC transporter ATP-binding protein [Microvirga sp. BT689]|uniref:ABC transporter ATP-binding protein n=1 Tax=Microvirga arvi TaxID=2778731 RepID=UPI0019524DC5|nr:ABC transporter ATP-binding protein [Microvirga arvi]MBM6581300.1 ABC transporter ATP-binding protein [Microvirga arvi]
MPNVLRADGITVKFGGVTAVNNVSLSLGSGEILGLIGPNGAGKTTLFNALTGFAPMHSGRITLLDRDITALPAFKRTRLGFGRTFQTERPFEELTVLENVLIAAFLTVVRRSEAEHLAMSVLEQVGLADRAHQPALDLNLARRRRLELAKALAVKPKVIFLDEIMAGLNPPALREMITFVRSLSAQGLAVLMVEHIMEAIIELSDHVIVLASGEKIAEGTPQQVTSNERVIEAYLGTD